MSSLPTTPHGKPQIHVLQVGQLRVSRDFCEVMEVLVMSAGVAVIGVDEQSGVMGLLYVTSAVSARPGELSLRQGLPRLLSQMRRAGAVLEEDTCRFVLVGCSGHRDFFAWSRVGQENLLAAKALLQAQGIDRITIDSGEAFCRRVHLELWAQRVTVQCPDRGLVVL